LNPNTKAHLALFTVALIYGANYTIAKEVMDNNYIQPLGFIVLRASAGIVLFWIFHHLFIKEKIDKKDFPKLFLCALFGVAINQMLFFSGLKLTKPINAALIMTTTPIIVLVCSAFLLKEHVTFRKVIGIILGAAGAIFLIVYGKSLSFDWSQIKGDLMCLGNTISFGVYLVLVKSLMKKYHPITLVKWIFTIGIFLVLPFGYEEVTMIDWSSFHIGIWIAVAYVLICTTFLTYLFNAYALNIVDASVVAIYIYLQPFIATIIALMFGKDELVVTKIVAGGLIFVGVYLVSSQYNKKNK